MHQCQSRLTLSWLSLGEVQVSTCTLLVGMRVFSKCIQTVSQISERCASGDVSRDMVTAWCWTRLFSCSRFMVIQESCPPVRYSSKSLLQRDACLGTDPDTVTMSWGDGCQLVHQCDSLVRTSCMMLTFFCLRMQTHSCTSCWCH
ncbi:hypothetical protein AUEXF2481DRAFT_675547 [Aureobasidium subglaciale EXF-2481]|uniref:Uncharacterized protein n=1 Tax=Aureobasidium subglaciale (strain EXF-2481) TaxID=1043005 RepID=A0A074YJP1_AURSE|nr:uncharacterized protein AUEXF2481DRAFT_675547 [Aureobasidium subglaciale EXF-2481]KEQ96284.1 hypothetical protein AUEXF2481DRAFT_675547 [Aureobasidium subglaciale EXF-2481]